jgi:hypothetical protein
MRRSVRIKYVFVLPSYVSWPEAVELTVELSSKIFDGAGVRACGIFRVITVLEFLQHHFAKMDHSDTFL